MVDVAARRKHLQEEQAAQLEAQVTRLLAPLTGEERALDAGCGTGALALALAPHVAEVVGVDPSSDFLEAARRGAPANCVFLEGDAMALPFEYGSFDIGGCLRLLHHVRRPELVVSELARVTRPGGRILVADQLGNVDPVVSAELDRFERARDASHQRLLPDGDIRYLLDANDLTVVANEVVREQRELERFLDLAGLAGEHRERVRRMAPAPVYEIELGWYVAVKHGA
jgi:SAM-dependent methyltransferase